MPKLNNNQSDLQLGFTRGLSPIMAALIVSEVILQAKLQTSNLYYIGYIRQSKGIWCCTPYVTLGELYYEVPPEIWKVIQDLYSDMSSQVKWNGYTCKNFNIKQGVMAKWGPFYSPV